MSLNIKDKEVHELARKLAKLTGESMTAAVKRALKERLEREECRPAAPGLAEKLKPLLDEFDKLPVLDDRSADEIIGYDEHGLPGPSGNFALTDIHGITVIDGKTVETKGGKVIKSDGD